MLRRLLREDGGERVSLEKLDLFQQNPGLLEKFLIGSEVSLEVLDLFLTRLFGSEGLSGMADAKEAVESVKADLELPREKMTGRGDEQWAVGEELKQQVLDLTRQLSALQRQLQMQGEVSQVAASIEGRLEEVASACERRAAETDKAIRAEIHRVDVSSQVSDVARGLGELKKELGLRANAEDLQKLAEEVSRLKEAERGLRDEVQGKIERLEMMAPLIHPLDGIIAHLTRKCGGNVHEKGVVTVTASSVGSGRPENVVDLTSDSYFFTKDSPDSWIRYDFEGRRVTPTSYSIRSMNWGPRFQHPKSWVVEVSNDGSDGSWAVIDSRNNNSDLNDKYVTRNFALSAPLSGAFRFVRLRQTGKNHKGNDLLWICAFELFGALSE